MVKIALGTVQFGLNYGISNKDGKVGRAEVEKILKTACDNGINLIDTAISYGNSEQLLGEIGIREFKVVSKIPAPPENILNIESWIDKQVEASLKKLKLDSLYGLLLHNTDILRGVNGRRIASKLSELKRKQLIQNIGVSFHSARDLSWITEIIDLNIVQGPLNLVDRNFENSGWIESMHHSGVEIHTRSAFLQGLLLLKRDEIPGKFERWYRLWDKWHNLLAEKKINATKVCLSYPLSLNLVDKVVVGVASNRQFSELIEYTHEINSFDIIDFSFLCSDDENLVNPAKWINL